MDVAFILCQFDNLRKLRLNDGSHHSVIYELFRPLSRVKQTMRRGLDEETKRPTQLALLVGRLLMLTALAAPDEYL